MKIASETEQAPVVTKPKAQPKLVTYSAKLSDGREVTIREMTGRDLLYMEKDLSSAGDIEKGMKIIERLCVGIEKLTYEDVLDLGVRDFKRISDLVGKASGSDEEEDPK